MNIRQVKYFKQELRDAELGDPYVNLELHGVHREDTRTNQGPPEERKFYVDLDGYTIDKRMGINKRRVKMSVEGQSWCYFFDKDWDEMMYVRIKDSKYIEGITYNEQERIRMHRQREILDAAQSVKTLEYSYHYILEFYLEDPMYLLDQSKDPKNCEKAKERARNQSQQIPDDEDGEESEEEGEEDVVQEY
jgi:hypothetical protein